jgi:MFS transporter, MHS family, proline/betaine transporter
MDERTETPSRRAIAAAIVGNVFEWYDFVVYSYFATTIARTLFPPGDEPAALLETFAAFGIGFVARPIGAIVIGWFGDKKGRKAALILTIAVMAAGTVLVGLIPSYTAIGALAPFILVLARLAQGFSVGGEWGNSTAFMVEWAPQDRRGFYSSFQQSSLVAGLLLGSGVAATLNTVLAADTMQRWGWRIPFLIGGLVALVGVYMRRNVEEPPIYRRLDSAADAAVAPRLPIVETAQAFGFMIVWAVQFYIFLAYMPTFTQKYAGLSGAAALWSNTAGLLLLMIAIPPFGLLSDRIGRKPLLIASCVAFMVLPYPLFSAMLNGASFSGILAIQLLVALAIALYSGAGAAAISEIFPTRVRTTFLSAANGTAVAIFGGFAPFIATWLIEKTGSPISPTYYVIAAAIVSAAVIFRLPETAHAKLR